MREGYRGGIGGMGNQGRSVGVQLSVLNTNLITPIDGEIKPWGAFASIPDSKGPIMGYSGKDF